MQSIEKLLSDICTGTNWLVNSTFMMLLLTIGADMIGINPIYAMGKMVNESLDVITRAPKETGEPFSSDHPPHDPIDYGFFDDPFSGLPQPSTVPSPQPGGEQDDPFNGPILADFTDEGMI